MTIPNTRQDPRLILWRMLTCYRTATAARFLPNTPALRLTHPPFHRMLAHTRWRFFPTSEYSAVCGERHTAMRLAERAIIHRATLFCLQCCFNLINPSAGVPAPEGFPYQDYRQLIDTAAARQIGVIAIRVLAGGALSGSVARHVNAARTVDPVAVGQSFAEDVKQSQRFAILVQEGYVDNLIEAAIRFVIGKVEVSTVLIGISAMEQLEQAVAYSAKGPLPAEALGRLGQLWGNDALPSRPYESL